MAPRRHASAQQLPRSGHGDDEEFAAVAASEPSSSSYTVDQALDQAGLTHAFLMLGYCGLSWMCDAMEVMVLSYLAPSARCEWDLTKDQESGLSSVVFAGMCIGAPVWGMVSDTRGRKTSFFLATLISAVFGFASAAAPNYHALMAFRALVGFGIPAATVAFNLVLEFTPSRQRGLFAVAIEGFWTIGTVIQASLAYALLNSHGWRILLAVSTTPYAVLLLLLPLLPESPRYLLVMGRVEAAERVLGKVMRVCRRQLPQGSLQPLLSGAEVERSEDEGTKRSLRHLGRRMGAGAISVWAALKQLFSRQLWAVTAVLMFVWVVAAFVYYGLVLLVPNLEFIAGEKKECRKLPGHAGGQLWIPTADPIGNLITSAAEVPGLIFSLFMIHFVSRKLAFGLPMACIPIVLIPLMAGVKGNAIVVCMFLARFFIYSAFNALWALCPEFYPTCVRNFGLGVNNAASRIGGLIAPFAVQASQGPWPRAPEAIFAGMALVAALAILALPHDKKDRALDDTLDEVSEVPPLQRGVSSLRQHVSQLSHRSAASHGRAGTSAAGARALDGACDVADGGLVAKDVADLPLVQHRGGAAQL